MTSNAKDSRNLSNVFILVTTSMVAILLIWNATLRIDNFNARQLALAKQSVTSAASEASLLIRSYQRAVSIFAEDNQAYIGSVAEWPQDAGLHSILKERIEIFFPESFSFTLADSGGNTLLEGFEALVGPRCKADIREFSQHETAHEVYMHQGHEPIPPHFDIMARIGGNESSGNIFFISFHRDTLERILSNTAVADHHILLLRRDKPGTIDAVSNGVHNLSFPDNRLPDEDAARISHALQVEGTGWDVAILPDRELHSDAYRGILGQSVIILLGFLFISLVMRMLLLDEGAR
jgi:hypothetical protein